MLIANANDANANDFFGSSFFASKVGWRHGRIGSRSRTEALLVRSSTADRPASPRAVVAVTPPFPAIAATVLFVLVMAIDTKFASARISTNAEAISYITLYASFLLTPGRCLVLLLQHSKPGL